MLELLAPMSQLHINDDTVKPDAEYKGLALQTLRVRIPQFNIHTYSTISDVRLNGTRVMGDKQTLADFYPCQVLGIRLVYRGGVYALCDDGTERYVAIPHLTQTQEVMSSPDLSLYFLKGIAPPIE